MGDCDLEQGPWQDLCSSSPLSFFSVSPPRDEFEPYSDVHIGGSSPPIAPEVSQEAYAGAAPDESALVLAAPDIAAASFDLNEEHNRWPKITIDSQGEPVVQQWIFDILRAYESRKNLCRTSLPINFKDASIPVFPKSPKYDSPFVKSIADHFAISSAYHMERLICVVDKALDTGKADTGGITFAGSSGRTLSDPVDDGPPASYIGRVGADKLPDNSVIKPWRYDIVQSKSDPLPDFYLCLFVPYKSKAKTKAKRCRKHPAESNAEFVEQTMKKACKLRRQAAGSEMIGDSETEDAVFRRVKKILASFAGGLSVFAAIVGQQRGTSVHQKSTDDARRDLIDQVDQMGARGAVAITNAREMSWIFALFAAVATILGIGMVLSCRRQTQTVRIGVAERRSDASRDNNDHVPFDAVLQERLNLIEAHENLDKIEIELCSGEVFVEPCSGSSTIEDERIFSSLRRRSVASRDSIDHVPFDAVLKHLKETLDRRTWRHTFEIEKCDKEQEFRGRVVLEKDGGVQEKMAWCCSCVGKRGAKIAAARIALKQLLTAASSSLESSRSHATSPIQELKTLLDSKGMKLGYKIQRGAGDEFKARIEIEMAEGTTELLPWSG